MSEYSFKNSIPKGDTMHSKTKKAFFPRSTKPKFKF